jgi:hypothetical protein
MLKSHTHTGSTDVVVEVFKKQQQRFRSLMDEHSKVRFRSAELLTEFCSQE